MPKHNRHITIISYGFMIVFACLLVYFSIFVLRDNSKLLNNPYNKTDRPYGCPYKAWKHSGIRQERFLPKV